MRSSSSGSRPNGPRSVGADSGLTPEQIVTESRRYGNHLGIEFGTAYASAAVAEDGTKPPAVEDVYSDYAPSGTPGCRAPHAWLGARGERFSTLDLFGPGFTLVTAGCDADAWSSMARETASQLCVQIDHYAIGSAGLQAEAGFAETYGLEAGGAVLVRPDGHVGWRHTGHSGCAHLSSVLKQLLGL